MNKVTPIQTAFFLVIAVVLFSCSKKDGITTSSYSSDDIFKGVMFMNGDYAKDIPEIQDQIAIINQLNPTDENKSQLNQVEMLIMDQIKKDNPGYIEEFANSMKSHDHVRIAQEIDSAENAIFNVLMKCFNITPDQSISAKEQFLDTLNVKQSQVENLITEFKLHQISNTDFETQIGNVLNINQSNFERLLTSKINGGLADRPAATTNTCIVAVVGVNVGIAVNVAGAVNVALITNVAAGVNLAVMVNVYVVAGNVSGGGSFGGLGNRTVPLKKADRPALPTGENLNYESYINSIASSFN
jgi:SdpC family antimicrobial peptide